VRRRSRRFPAPVSITRVRRVVASGVMLLAGAASTWIFTSVDAGSHSASDTLYGAALPLAIVWASAVAVLVVAARTMKGR
jgi:hypothetical protein